MSSPRALRATSSSPMGTRYVPPRSAARGSPSSTGVPPDATLAHSRATRTPRPTPQPRRRPAASRPRTPRRAADRRCRLRAMPWRCFRLSEVGKNKETHEKNTKSDQKPTRNTGNQRHFTQNLQKLMKNQKKNESAFHEKTFFFGPLRSRSSRRNELHRFSFFSLLVPGDFDSRRRTRSPRPRVARRRQGRRAGRCPLSTHWKLVIDVTIVFFFFGVLCERLCICGCGEGVTRHRPPRGRSRETRTLVVRRRTRHRRHRRGRRNVN